MTFSLIINTYNSPEFLENCLLSVSVQSELPDEIIITDDGSTQDLISIIKKYKKILNIPIKYVTQEDKGFRLARCRNNGAKESSGSFIFYLDQDLIFSKNFIATIKNNIRKNHFIVGWPIRTTKKQLAKINADIIKNCNYESIVTQEQIQKVQKQFKKDRIYRILHNIKLRKMGTKIRGCANGLFKDDFIKINGYDEKYIGWGNEDDDFGRRLYLSGVKGLNPFKKDYPVHLWHPENHEDGERVNLDYHKKRFDSLSKESYRCEYGYDNSLGEDKYKVIEI